MAEFNHHFRVSPTQMGSAFLPCRHRDLDLVFCLQKTKDRFPTPLGNPATPAGFPLSPSHDGGE